MSFGISAAAYDRAITIFSPDGRIYQVEYAFESVRRGWTTVGLKSKTAAMVVVEKKKIAPLVDENLIQKIFKIDDHVGSSFAGIASDGRVLIEYARQVALLHRLYYDEPAPIEYLAKRVCDVKQAYTQHAGVRPFGVAVIFAGIDEQGTQLFMTEPSGRYLSYYAVAIGEKANAVSEFMEKNYKYDMSVEETIKLGIQAIASVLDAKPSSEFIEAGYVDTDSRKFKIMSRQEIDDVLKQLAKEGKVKM
ncbi:proteasome subunit alpha [Thermogladius calderae 1633]|uniref:Proteasome subunit alpha n=1 Tax=Thermogladius calderae (strain DSM 22663 / VKM B-2946 / 1633) TaxID=1184251 RepID=I3TDJ6_THEC1|nr:archaeal proteasome endopeptidase complex subunit alpha [Thermogladius calderae]AFK50834.1 proteasome subunit alpha [Thermogladius calderae 1633]